MDMRFGAHVSIKGGLAEAPMSAAAYGCECFQIFTRSPRGGRAAPLTHDVIRAFREACEESGQAAWYIHTPYYVNLASGDRRIRSASIRVVREELERGCAIGAAAVMTHMGSDKEIPRAEALRRVIDAVYRILDGYAGSTQLLAEVAAGAGMILGDSFEELGELVRATGGRCGVCFDTQHAFASGYDLRTPESVRETFDAFEAAIGLRYLKLSHCNDSLVPLGSRRDRHEHIGEGAIGMNGFRSILAERRLGGIDFILETRLEGVGRDLRRLKRIRADLRKESSKQ